MDLQRERNMALAKARIFARNGQELWAWLWLERARQFWPVSHKQVQNLNRLCKTLQFEEAPQ